MCSCLSVCLFVCLFVCSSVCILFGKAVKMSKKRYSIILLCEVCVKGTRRRVVVVREPQLLL